MPTVTDILKELEKPGRDPRPEFTTATFKEGVEEIRDLRPDMILEGVVTNVAAFGAFVDIGVHQDGLVHISALSNTFVKDPHTVVKAGQVVKVKVLEVDEKRKRIALTMRLSDSAPQAGSQAGAARRPQRPQAHGPAPAAGARSRRRPAARWRRRSPSSSVNPAASIAKPYRIQHRAGGRHAMHPRYRFSYKMPPSIPIFH